MLPEKWLYSFITGRGHDISESMSIGCCEAESFRQGESRRYKACIDGITLKVQ
jgi:hypothetical protein